MGKLIRAGYLFITNRPRVFQLDGDTVAPYETKGPVKKPPKKVHRLPSRKKVKPPKNNA